MNTNKEIMDDLNNYINKITNCIDKFYQRNDKLDIRITLHKKYKNEINEELEKLEQNLNGIKYCRDELLKQL